MEVSLNLKDKSKDKSKGNKKELRNYFVLYGINLNLTFKNVGVVLSGLLFLLMAIIFFSLETFSAVKQNNLKNYSLYKNLSYIFLSGTIIFQVLLTSLYLFKRQFKNGITAIELRAGYKAWKSFTIRILIELTVLWVYVTIALVIVVFLNLISGANMEIFASLLYAQIFYLYFLSLISILIISALMIFFSTAISTSLGMVFICLVSLSPVFGSLKYIISSSGQTNYLANIKLKAGYDFYNNFKYDQNLFDDNAEKSETDLYEKSKTLSNISENIEKIINPLVDTGEFNFSNFFSYFDNKSYLSKVPLHLDSYDIGNETLNLVRIQNILTKNLTAGQILYNYNLYNHSSNDPIYIFEGNPIWDFLYKINNEIFENMNNYSSYNETKLPDIFSYTNYSNQNKLREFLNIKEIIEQLSAKIPEYKDLLKYIENFYKEYSLILASSTRNNNFYNSAWSLNSLLDIFSLQLDSNNSRYFNWKDSFFRNNYYIDDYMCEKIIVNENGEKIVENICNEEVIDKNDKISKMYRKFPELAIINVLAINLWKEAMVFDIPNFNIVNNVNDINEGLYNYFNEGETSNTLTTDIFRHFSVMSSGVFTSPLINDSYNSQSSLIFQGQTIKIKNIFNFENQAPINKKEFQALEPVYKDKKFEYKNAFIIPLAYFIYLLLVSPLSYLSYFTFNRKSKL
ncbi:ABC transporter permease [Spiroplasma taiwanense]|uniref:Uncharacterized protein n=1 Tax=Spiroplasma taiwanense CT-1 TaxID=1276220 RepID=S5LT00_9MOLU|nr:ABC transporter permease [Spiroplasma taiwanense]AGR40809.1 hypothetical protein STAIW_v1c01230 [Spiroplasma taiwanense CT-1]